jgi:hypothetical protein
MIPHIPNDLYHIRVGVKGQKLFPLNLSTNKNESIVSHLVGRLDRSYRRPGMGLLGHREDLLFAEPIGNPPFSERIRLFFSTKWEVIKRNQPFGRIGRVAGATSGSRTQKAMAFP